MTPSAYALTITQLEQEIGTLDQRCAGLAAAIASLRAIDGNGAAPAAMPHAERKPRASTKPASKAKAAKPDAGTRTRITPEQLAELKRCYERGDNVEELAEAMGMKAQAVYYHASSKGWKRGQGATAVAAAPIAGTRTPTHQCSSCQLRTSQDPCEHCGVRWKR